MDKDDDEEREAEVKQKPRPKPNLHGVSGWLNKIDRLFIIGYQLQFIKLSFMGDEPQIFWKIQDKESLSEVYQIVKAELYRGNEKTALSRIVYTLKLIGHRNLGERAIKLLHEDYSELNPEEYNPRNNTMLVQLYQCLSQIASRLSVDQEKALRKHFTDSWGIHPEAQVAKDAFSLFSHLVQSGKVTIHNQLELARGLKTASNPVRHFHYLMEYRNRNLDSIDGPQEEYLDIFPDYRPDDIKSSVTGGNSSPSNSTPLSSDGFYTADDMQRRVTSSKRNTSATHTENLSPTVNVVTVSANPNTETEHRPEASTQGNRPVMNWNPAPEQPLAQSSRVHWGWKLTCTTLSLLAVASLLVIGFSGYILTGAQSTHEMRDEILVYSNSVIPLADHLHPFYLSEIDLTLVKEEKFCKVDFYLINKACSSLDPDEEISNSHLQTDEIKERDNHMSSMIFTGWYLLQNSFVRYNICAVTNSSYENSTNPILLEMYVLDTLNETCISNTDQVPPRASKFANISVCYESRMEQCTQECNIITFTADHEAYYSVRFFLNYPDLSTTMRYTFLREVKKYSYPHLRSNLDIVAHHCSLEPTETLKKCSLPLKDSFYHLPWNVNSEQCILADIHGKLTGSGEISDIELSTLLYQPDWLLISAIIVGVAGCVFAVLFVSNIGVCFCIYKKRKRGAINVADTERENLLSGNTLRYEGL